ncbi:MAG: tRNA (N6-threonylcarbamoyladenosine(37)-N6)-methyltransferase TrmO [Lachnospiraceae bacterium]|nr:tRNA (N6-threonylcarbamoyladenosine(37)-N6)-methyltransferase TrmO [Lachnospiraceae bacterium]
MEKTIRPIARIRSDYKEKFGIPRQSGLVPEAEAEIVFETAFRSREALRGIEEFTHLWLIWGFSEIKNAGFRATVKPPRLDGEKKGVFATRSPYRPNGLGLSSVSLLSIGEDAKEGPVLHVAGADLLDGTPIYDIKPYIPYADSHPEASGSYSDRHRDDRVAVHFPEELLAKIPPGKRGALRKLLSLDPRGSYEKLPGRVYGLHFADYEVRFAEKDGILVVNEVLEAEGAGKVK